MHPREHREPPFTPELGHLRHFLVGDELRHAEVSRVGVADLVLVVGPADPPALVGEPEPLQLVDRVVHRPSVDGVPVLVEVGEQREAVGKREAVLTEL